MRRGAINSALHFWVLMTECDQLINILLKLFMVNNVVNAEWSLRSTFLLTCCKWAAPLDACSVSCSVCHPEKYVDKILNTY
jgi:hypothetical protein